MPEIKIIGKTSQKFILKLTIKDHLPLLMCQKVYNDMNFNPKVFSKVIFTSDMDRYKKSDANGFFNMLDKRIVYDVSYFFKLIILIIYIQK